MKRSQSGYPLVEVPCEYMPKVLTTRFPIFCIRSERISNPATLAPMWEFLAWSINIMFEGKWPSTGFRGLPVDMAKAGSEIYSGARFRLVEVRGDWKQHAEGFRLNHKYTTFRICHQCKASRDMRTSFCDFRAQPAWLPTTRTHQQFLLEEIGEPVNSLIFVAQFHYSMIKFDSMHSVNLGCGLHANGSSLYELLKISWFGVGERPVLFRSAYSRFRNFIRQHNIMSSQPVFKTWMLVTSGEEYCFFASKAQGIVNQKQYVAWSDASLGIRDSEHINLQFNLPCPW